MGKKGEGPRRNPGEDGDDPLVWFNRWRRFTSDTQGASESLRERTRRIERAKAEGESDGPAVQTDGRDKQKKEGEA